jgi:hypothetical protein
MAELTIRESLWADFVAVAERERVQPDELAERVLRDYIQRAADEELLAASERAARRARFRMADTEEICMPYGVRALGG